MSGYEENKKDETGSSGVVRDYKGKYEEIKGLKPVRQGTYLGEEGEKFYVALSDEEVYELSPLAYYVWLLCDGQRSIEELARSMSEDIDVSLDELIGPLVSVIESLHDAKLVKY
ncbi:PqqD family protein [Thermogladius sp. 4427co]|uniref:PqqD family protein n=1 Tax=Thermogladius sp. 4427co TaxID=3450718 RepID=UPI003F7B316C